VKTASIREYKGAGRICIARLSRFKPAGYRVYRLLQPTREMRRASWRVYKRLYLATLARLDAQTVWDELNALAGGAEPVLLYWESREESDYCHRRGDRSTGHMGTTVPNVHSLQTRAYALARGKGSESGPRAVVQAYPWKAGKRT
jgi:hypothetical protein